MAKFNARRYKEATVITSTAIYAAGDLVGTKLTFSDVIASDVVGGSVESLLVVDKGKQSAALDLLLFDEDFSTGTATTWATGDNAALTLADSDALNCIGVINVSTGDYSILAANSIAHEDVSIPFFKDPGISRHLYGLLVSRGTPTYESSGDIQLAIGVEGDV